MHVSRILTAAILAVAVGAAACSNSEPGPAAEATEPRDEPTTESESTSPSPIPTQAAVDPTVVPDEITVEYLDAVMDRFDEMEAEVYSMLAESGDTRHAPMLERYFSFGESGWAVRSIEGLEQALGLEALSNSPRPPKTTVLEIVDQNDHCVLFTAERDFRPILDEDVDFSPNQPYYVEVQAQAPSELNPIPWQIQYSTWFAEGAEVPGGCGEDVS